jgi:hypothetical protein
MKTQILIKWFELGTYKLPDDDQLMIAHVGVILSVLMCDILN